MAVVFVLGPSQWRTPGSDRTEPIAVRRRLATRLRDAGHRAMLIEDIDDDPEDRDLLDKFERVLDTESVTDVLVYHPARAKMQATLHELLLLAARSDEAPTPRVWLLVHEEAATLDGFRFHLKESGLGSRYLDAVHRLRPVVLPWRTADRLRAHVDHVAEEI